MTYKKKVQLQDGSTVLIKELTSNENVHEFLSFINAFTRENTYLLLDRPITLKQEKEWLKKQIQANKKGELIYLKALVDNHLVGLVHAQRGMYRNRGNVMLGVALRKHWRGKGLGWILMKELIVVVEQRWHPLHIYLHVVSSNTKARALYKSLGFRMIARLPQWFEYNGKYLDEYILILDKKYFQKVQKNNL